MENAKKLPLRIAFISLALTIATHLYLSLMHFGLKTGSAGGQSICSISDKFNCEAVAMSPYAELFGAPLALWALFFSLLIFFTLIGFATSKDARLYRWTVTLATVAVAASIVMASISLTKMATFCLFCIFAYILSVITLICLWITNQNAKFITTADIRGLFVNKWLSAGFVAVPILTFLVNDMNLREFKNATRSIKLSSIQEWSDNPIRDFSEFVGIKLGPENARFKIIEFADFLCPHCMHAASMLSGFALAHPDVQLTFYPFPLDSQCNPVVQMSDGGLRCTLAKLTLCADKHGKGWDIYHWAFKHFADKDVLTVSNASKEFALNEAELHTCIDSIELAKGISVNGNKAKEYGVQGTPTIFVNGKILPGGNLLIVLEALYNSL